jgi:aminomethyltransferase
MPLGWEGDLLEMAEPQGELRRTPLYDLHREFGAKFAPFAGYDMPVQYAAGILREHQHTRDAAGLFDVSHMGQLTLSGAGAAVALEALMPIDVVGLPRGRQR